MFLLKYVRWLNKTTHDVGTKVVENFPPGTYPETHSAGHAVLWISQLMSRLTAPKAVKPKFYIVNVRHR